MERNSAWLTYSAQDMEGLERINLRIKLVSTRGRPSGNVWQWRAVWHRKRDLKI